MEIGTYVCFAGALWLFGLGLFKPVRQRLGIYLALGGLIPLIALCLYLLLPPYVGIYGTNPTVPQRVDLHTFLDGGIGGMALVLLYTVGAFWPIFAAWILGRPSAWTRSA